MSDFNNTLSRMSTGAVAGGALGAKLGGTVVSGVSAMSGSVVGPAGTFFGAAVGKGVGSAVGGMAGTIIGALGGLFSE
ncbi:MAG: hypothetical protein ACI4KM_13050 [Oscillospiraceae bacterium]